MPPDVAVPHKGPCKGWKGKKMLPSLAPDPGTMGPRKPGAKAAGKLSVATQRKREARKLVKALGKGEEVEADAELIHAMMQQLVGAPPMNLAKLNVRGEKNKNLFNKPLRDIPRKGMPTFPDNVAKLMPFIQEISRRYPDLKVELVELDPRDIMATQSELSAPKVASMAGLMKNGWKPGGAMIVSQENALLDGHHRWAGAAVASILHEQGIPGWKPVKVMALKIDLPIDDLLALSREFSGPPKDITEKP